MPKSRARRVNDLQPGDRVVGIGTVAADPSKPDQDGGIAVPLTNGTTADLGDDGIVWIRPDR
ncbi:hypothetical protein [Frankia tisae]|uniref:hypothetical protein n=1 Tax=Frankia tisae TaxID=2950104 RepID=UPI0021C0980C|nr:hypothetical protein [Frankia tisae]